MSVAKIKKKYGNRLKKYIFSLFYLPRFTFTKMWITENVELFAIRFLFHFTFKHYFMDLDKKKRSHKNLNWYN